MGKNLSHVTVAGTVVEHIHVQLTAIHSLNLLVEVVFQIWIVLPQETLEAHFGHCASSS